MRAVTELATAAGRPLLVGSIALTLAVGSAATASARPPSRKEVFPPRC